MFGKLLKGATKMIKSGAKVATQINKVPMIGNVAKMVPGLGTVLGAASLATSAYNTFKPSGGGGGGLPALPGGGGGGLPALPGSASAPAVVGNRSVFRDDPNISEALKAWAISAHNLRTAYRSPIKGYVVVRDVNGDPYALPKQLARQYAGWRPSKKPPISVGEWESLKRAHRTVKKVRKVASKMAQVEKSVTKGGKVKVKK